MFPAVRLLRLLPQQFVTARKRAEELIVQIVPVSEHDERWILHRRMHYEPTGIERHGERLSRSLRVPDHAHALIPDFTSGLWTGKLSRWLFLKMGSATRTAGAHRFSHRCPDRVKL